MSSAPVEDGSPELAGQTGNAAVVGEMAYVADGDSGLRVVDVSVSGSPVERGFETTPGTAFGVAVSNGLVVLADNDAGVAVFDDCRDVVSSDGFDVFDASAWSFLQP